MSIFKNFKRGKKSSTKKTVMIDVLILNVSDLDNFKGLLIIEAVIGENVKTTKKIKCGENVLKFNSVFSFSNVNTKSAKLKIRLINEIHTNSVIDGTNLSTKTKTIGAIEVFLSKIFSKKVEIKIFNEILINESGADVGMISFAIRNRILGNKKHPLLVVFEEEKKIGIPKIIKDDTKQKLLSNIKKEYKRDVEFMKVIPNSEYDLENNLKDMNNLYDLDTVIVRFNDGNEKKLSRKSFNINPFKSRNVDSNFVDGFSDFVEFKHSDDYFNSEKSISEENDPIESEKERFFGMKVEIKHLKLKNNNLTQKIKKFEKENFNIFEENDKLRKIIEQMMKKQKENIEIFNSLVELRERNLSDLDEIRRNTGFV